MHKPEGQKRGLRQWLVKPKKRKLGENRGRKAKGLKRIAKTAWLPK